MPATRLVARSDLSAGAYGVWCFALLGLVIPAAAVQLTPSADLGLWGPTLAAMIWSAIRLSGLFATAQPYLYSVTTWVFVYVFLGLAATLQIRLHIDPDTVPNIVGTSQRSAVVVVVLGIAAIEAGMWWAGRVEASYRLHGYSRRTISADRVNLLTGLTLLFLVYSVSRTGVAPYFQSREALGQARAAAWPDPSVSALVSGLMLALPLVTLHAMVWLRRSAVDDGLSKPYAFRIPVMLAAVLLTTNLVSSARINFGTVLLSIAILFGATATRSRTRSTILALLVAMIVVFPLADLFRFSEGSAKTFDVKLLAISGDYDAFAQIANSVLYVDANGVEGGRQFLGVLLFWVPRAFWADKPIDTGVLIGEFRGYGFTNLSAPLWAEGFINGGFVGVVALLALFGYLVRRGDLAFSSAVARGGVSAITGAILPFYMIIVLRGSLLQATGTLAALGFAVWLSSKPASQQVRV